jgi:hypothetical protein
MATHHRWWLAALLFGVLAWVQMTPHQSGAASFCRSREDDLLEADVIFSGVVTRVERHDIVYDYGPATFTQTVNLRVLNSWKGNVPAQVVVQGGPAYGRDCGVGNCGYTFKPGVSYLVFTYRQGTDTKYVGVADRCSRTALLSSPEARQDLAALGPGNLPPGGVGENIAPHLLLAGALIALGVGLRAFGQRTRAGI